MALTLLQVLIQIRFNLWNRDFFNALETRDRDAFLWQMVLFLGLTVSSMVTAVYQLYVKQLVQLRWREWLTTRLLSLWMTNARHYQLERAGEADNPDQRIAEDARLSVDLAVDFVTGIFNSAVMLIAFIGILWTISGALSLNLAGHSLTIPGYMVWAALIYAAIGSGLTYLVGRPMVALNFWRTAKEADFRFGLVRARESSEGIALIGGEADERRGLQLLFGNVAGAVARPDAQPAAADVAHQRLWPAGENEAVAFGDVQVASSNGSVVIAEATAEIKAGERVLVKGESGTGKSTLFRAFAGIWP